MLPFQTFTFSSDEKAIVFSLNKSQWAYDLKTFKIEKTG